MKNLPVIFKQHTSLDEGKELLGTVKLRMCLHNETDICLGITADAFLVDWGDGKSDHLQFHHYRQPGEYQVRIVGTAIHQLDVSKCHLVELKLEKCVLLQILRCAYNQLRTLELVCCPELKWLDCSTNQLSVLRLRCNHQMLFLDCSENILQNLEIEACPDLLYLYCFSNQLHHLYLGECNQLICIDAGDNQFEREGLYQLLNTLPDCDRCRKAVIRLRQKGKDNIRYVCELAYTKGWKVI